MWNTNKKWDAEREDGEDQTYNEATKFLSGAGINASTLLQS